MGRKADFEAQLLDEARADVAIADQKAAVILASAGIGFGAVLGGLLAGDWKPGDFNAAGEVTWWFGAAFAFGVVVSVAVALWPRFTTKNEDARLTYWGHVVRYATLESLVSALEDNKADRERNAHQLWRLSKVVQKKYRWIRRSMVSGAVAVVLFTAAGLIG